jgi:DNA-binding beta-propeller fold protein YncE
VAVDASGNIYVADNFNHRIQKFTSSSDFITKWDTLGSVDGQFDRPEGVAIDTSGNVYVTDTFNHRIQVFGHGSGK